MSVISFFRKIRQANFWKAQEPEPVPGTIYFFDLDHRPIGDEILMLVDKLRKYGECEYPVKIDGVTRKIYFIGDDFYCPYSTKVFAYIAISDGKFYRCKKDLELNLEFDMISYEFMVQLRSALQGLISQKSQ